VIIPKRPNSNQDGFTLFEAIVALAVLTLGLGAFYRAIAGGAAGIHSVERASLAVQIAKAKLAAEGIERPLAIGQHEGDDASGLHWVVRVQLYTGGARAPSTADPMAYLVTSSVSWPGKLGGTHPGLELTTIQVVAAP
jgi:prepilin-type N-terminal cleavage/methylation domain-containing protein